MDDQWLGIKWRDQVYVVAIVVFGLRSAIMLFTALAYVLEWCTGVLNMFHTI